VTGTPFSPHFDWGSTISKLAQNIIKSQAKQALQNALPGGKSGGGLGGLLNRGGGSGGSAPSAGSVGNALKGLFGH
jgi:hypothetical protein